MIVIAQIRRVVRWFAQRLWLRPAIYGAAAVTVVVFASLTDRFFGGFTVIEIAPSVVETLLSIIATSMLSVTIFAVSVMNSAYSAAIGATTPRAFDIIIADNSTKQALSSFVGAFIFAVIGIVGLNFGSFGAAGRVVMFAMTLSVFVWVIGTFIYWIDYVTRLGHMRLTVNKVAANAQRSLTRYLERPVRGATPVDGKTHRPPLGAAPITLPMGGVVQDVSVSGLLETIESDEINIDIVVRSGSVVGPNDPVCFVSGKVPSPELSARIAKCFLVGSNHDVENDPRYALRLMSEIADRALSPGINDPGTANEILDQLVVVFCCAFAAAQKAEPANIDDRITMATIEPEQILGAAFDQIARDGAGLVEVAEHLQMALKAIDGSLPQDWREHAKQQARQAQARAFSALQQPWERERLSRAAKWAET